MALRNFTADRGYRITQDGENPVDIIQGLGVPGGDGDIQDDAPIGSIYLRRDAGGLYKKTADNNNNADWEEVGNVSLDELFWRQETVRAATVDTLAVGSVDPTGFSDNESGIDGTDFAVGELLLGDSDGTPVLYEVTAVTSATDITLALAADALAANDTFIVQHYLPDPGAAQEAQALIHSPDGTSVIKLADFNWAIADSIQIAPAYAAQNGTVSSADSVNSAIEKLDGNQQDIQTSSGISQGDVDYGTFTGTILPDNATNKELHQAMESYVEGIETSGKVTNVTTLQNVDTVLVDSYHEIEWEVVAFEQANPENKKYLKLSMLHNGTSTADATDYDLDKFSRKRIGSNFNVKFSVDLDGVGAAQVMRLRAQSSTAGVTIEFRRNGVRIA